MYNPTWRETRCDDPSCNKLLLGVDRAHKVQIDHLEIKGSILTQRYTQNGKNYWTYVTEEPPAGMPAPIYAFCNSKCLSGMIETREYMLAERRRENFIRNAKEETDRTFLERNTQKDGN